MLSVRAISLIIWLTWFCRAAEVVDFLCDFISATDIENYFPEWECSVDLSSDSYCLWSGIFCDSSDEIESIKLYDTGIAGYLPSSIDALTSLKSLDISYSYLSGSIPAEIGDLTNLEQLILVNNYLSGTFPDSFSQLSRLTHLDVEVTALSGSFPWWLTDLTKLKEVKLGSNGLTGSIPDTINQLFNLTIFDVSDNALTGSLPSEITQLTKLTFLSVIGNALRGSIPTDIGDISNLTTFAIADNDLTGSIPDSIGDLLSLEICTAMNNQLDGSLPSSLCNLQELQTIIINNNKISGPLPSCIGDMTNLKILYAYNNFLSGSFPSSIGDCLLLQEVIISNNDLTNSIPSDVSQLTDLIIFNLYGNSLNGTIPNFSTNLQQLQIGKNIISGTLPDLIGTLNNLMQLDVSHCNLTGTIPESIALLPNLVGCRLSNNMLSGTISMHFGIADSLSFLSLANNKLVGRIPSNLGSSDSLKVLLLGNNYLYGTITHGVGNVQYLDLSDNNFTGPLIPTSWDKHDLRYLDLSNNFLTGTLPSSLCDYELLIQLFITHNQLDPNGCYRGCLHLEYEDFMSDFDRCQDNQDIAMCELTAALNIEAVQDFLVVTTTETIETEHYGDERDYSWILQDSNAFQYEIKFNGLTMLQGNQDYILITGDGYTNFYTIDDNNWPGYGAPLLVIKDTSVTIQAYLDDPSSVYGFQITVTILSRGNGWRCVEETRIVDGVNVSQSFAYPCDWTGVTCSYEIVTALSTNGWDLVGTIPDSIGNLEYLTSLDFSYNSLSGSIPSTLGQLTLLSTLDLSSNSLTGTLPISLTNTSLSYLSVSSNRLNGSVPLVLTQMTTLSIVDLESNKFEGKLTSDLCVLPERNTALYLIGNAVTCYEACWSNVSDALFTHDDSVGYCAPSSQPTPMPTSPTFKPTTFDDGNESDNTNTLIIAVVCGVVGLCLLFAAYLYYTHQRFSVYAKIGPTEEQIELSKMLDRCPIHKAVLHREPLTVEFVTENIKTTNELTPNNESALDLILNVLGDKYSVSADVLCLLVDYGLPDTIRRGSVKYDHLCGSDYKQWCRIIQRNDEVCVAAVTKLLNAYKAQVTMLAKATDEFGRQCIDIASPRCKEAINKKLYLHERYQLLEGPPEHKTSSSLVKFAFDHLRKVNDAPMKVALKFMPSAESFKREISNRNVFSDDNGKFLLDVLDSYNPDKKESENDVQFRVDAIVKGFEDYPYCIVMEAAEQNLERFMSSQHIAGNDWEEIKRIFRSLVLSVQYLHNHGVVHCDIKPTNVVVLGHSTMRLIDFDGSLNYRRKEHCGVRYSTAYSPPEFFVLADNDEVKVGLKTANNLEGKVVLADPSQDMWSLGVLLFLLCSGSDLFCCNFDKNIMYADDLRALYEWSDELRNKRLSNISDKLARNLVSLLLMKDPEKRIDAVRVLDHPFLSGKQSTRLSGEKCEFDFFISYRVASDAHYANMLCDALTSKGLRVWLDSRSLQPGKNWEIGFCEGLFKSENFICLISKDGMNNSEVDAQNLCKLSHDSKCDNVLLEWMLALELQKRNLLKGIFPVFIGECRDSTVYDKYYFNAAGVADVSVVSVEEKLRSHLDRQGCGLPYNLNYSVKSVMNDIVSNQGGFLVGTLDVAMQSIVDKISAMSH